jgi:DNA end-binding protein Ku
MPRALWSGVLAFGLVNVPVGLFSATSEKTIRFNQLNRNTNNRIRYRKVDDGTGDEVATEDIVSGYDTGDGDYIVVERDELKSAAPGGSELMEISDFVDIDDIDPKYFRSTYYLAPRGKGADRAYALLRQAMRETGKAGIATMVMRDREHLAVIRAAGDALVVETLYFADEIRDADEVVGDLPADDSFADRELTIAKQLVESLSADWEPDRYHDTYRERVEALIDDKRTGSTTVRSADKPKSNVIDLMAALEQSIAESGRGRDKAGPAKDAKAKKSGTAKTVSATSDDEPAANPSAAKRRKELESLTKTELLDRASSADLKGRSAMSKSELVDALAAAPAGRRSAAS